MTKTVASETPKEASPSVVARHAATLKALPFSDVRDFDDATRGFLGTLENARIASAQGRVVWSLEPYGFLSGAEAPPTVDPSLWRQSRLNMNHGLFEVVPGVYQVRGLDIANMTLIEGNSGVIVVDTLTSIEGARAAMELYFQHRGKRPVAAVIFTHTHTDHWGGARGVLDDDMLASGRVPIIAPNLFMEHAVSENIIAGPAMMFSETACSMNRLGAMIGTLPSASMASSNTPRAPPQWSVWVWVKMTAATGRLPRCWK
jgi:alkyl sulfatase BDS1-like metallo-beta-lactamase superfamily hydrolase